MSIPSFRALRFAFALLLAAAAVFVWAAPIPGAEPRNRAVLGGLLMAAAVFGSPISDFLVIVPRRRG